MKKGLLFVFGVAAMMQCASVMAQPTLTVSGVSPQIGETTIAHSGSYVNPGSGGANQTWDFTALAGSQGVLAEAVAPSSTANGSLFPTATVAQTFDTSSTIYFNITASAMQNVGAYTSAAVQYSDPEDFLRFPFTFGDSYTDTWVAAYTSSVTFDRRGTTTVTADGYGTLITPAGTFNNVLRVHFVQVYRDSADLFGTPYIVNFNNDQYMYYQDGVHTQLANSSTLTSNGGLNYTGSTYYQAGAVSNSPRQDLLSSVNLFPNPTANNLTVAFSLPKNQELNVQLFNSVGQKVFESPKANFSMGLNQFPIDVSGLSEGIYFAKILANGEAVATKRFIVAR